MNFGFTIFAVLVLAQSEPGGLPTDRLDDYVQNMQLRRKACGPTALWYCLHRFGIPVDRDELCREAGIGTEGISLARLLELSEARGLQPLAINAAKKDVRVLPIPSILVVDQVHCVVYLGTGSGDDEVQYYEPATNRVLSASREKVERNWTGEAILFDKPTLAPVSYFSIAAAIASIVLFGGLTVHHFLRTSQPRSV